MDKCLYQLCINFKTHKRYQRTLKPYPYNEGNMKDVFHCAGERVWIDHKIKKGHWRISYRKKEKIITFKTQKKSVLVYNKVYLCPNIHQRQKKKHTGVLLWGVYSCEGQLAFPLKQRCSLTWLPFKEPASGRKAQTYQVTQRFSPQQFVQQ